MSSNSSASSRRSFLRMASFAAVAAPVFTEAHFAYAAQQFGQQAGNVPLGRLREQPPADAVLINANENPLGPCEAACQAIAKIAPAGGRYDLYGEIGQLTKTFAAQNDLPADHIAVYAGSSDPLVFSVLAFTSPTRSYVQADPTYEAGARATKTSGARTVSVALTSNYAHDVKGLVTADPNAGLIYLCNPNNPTGTVTARQDILFALEHKPKGSVLLVDEAYIHLTEEHSVLDQVAAGKDIIVLRTFSKIYGMAGIRCGVAAGRPDLLAKLAAFGQNFMSVTGATAAKVSLEDTTLVPMRRALIANTRNETIAWLKTNHYKVIGDPQTNCFMIDVGRPGHDVFTAMTKQKVYIGRTWPVWPNAVRVSVGTPKEMAQFRTAFQSVMTA